MRVLRLTIAMAVGVTLAACDPVAPGAQAPQGNASQSAGNTQASADRDARNAYYRGPRGGDTGR